MNPKKSHRLFAWGRPAFFSCLLLVSLCAPQAATFTERNPARDFDGLRNAGNTSPQGLWSNGNTMWVADGADGKLYAYKTSDKTRDPLKDFDTLSAAGNNLPTGLWSNGTTMWVTDWQDTKIYAYKMSDKSRDPDKDFDTLSAAGNIRPTGIWSDGDTMWVSDTADTIFAYKMSDRSRNPAKDFNIRSLIGNRYVQDIWSDGTTLWAADFAGSRGDDKLYAFSLSKQNRDASKDFNTLEASGNNQPRGLWADGTTMWVADAKDDKIYAYRLGPEPSISDNNDLAYWSLNGSAWWNRTFDFDNPYFFRAVVVDYSITQVGVSAMAIHEGASVEISPPDSDPNTSGHQVALSAGDNTTITITVTSESGNARDYTISVSRFSSWHRSQDFNTLNAAGNNNPRDLWSDGITMWVADAADGKLYAYKMSDKSRDPAKDFNTLSAAGNTHPTGIWSDRATMWVADWEDDKLYAYKMSDKTRDSAKDFDTLNAENTSPTGLWSDGTTMWVSDASDAIIYGYNMSDKSWNGNQDVYLGEYLYNQGIWSDRTTMWVAEFTGRLGIGNIWAFDQSTKRLREVVKDFQSPPITGNHHPRGLWSDGETMWVVDSNDDKIYAYHLSDTASLSSLEVSDAQLSPVFRKSSLEYSAEVDNTVASVTITATADRSEASITISPPDADPNTDGHQVALSKGANTITITVTDSNARISGRTYTVRVRRALSRDNTLRNLTMSNATLSPLPFRSNITYYTATVAHNVASTTITAEANHAEASVSISPSDADTQTEGHQVALTESHNTIAIAVTAADGSVQNYYLDVWVEDGSFDNTLQSLTLNNATLSPVFHGNTTNYTASVGQASAVTTVEVRANHSMAKTVILPADADRETAGHQVALIEGDNSIFIVVIAPNGNLRAYTIRVRRTFSEDASLKSLQLSGVTISPQFTAGTTSYRGSVARTATSTTITAQTNHSMARTVILPADADGETAGHQVALIEGINPITIVVIAPDGTSRIYNVSVTRTPHSVIETSLISRLSLNDRQDSVRDILLPSIPSTKPKVLESRLFTVEASPEGVRFVFLVADSGKEDGFTVEARSSLKTGQWRVLREGMDCAVMREDNGRDTRVTVILPNAEENQMFLRLIPKH